MLFHKKQLMHSVDIVEPHPRFAQLLLEQFGGATGELTAALQYWVQSFHCENAGIRDMLQDIAIEEFSHLEVVGRLIEQHTKNVDQTDAFRSTLFAVRGMGPHFLDSQGVAWTAAYINEGGDVVRDLRANVAAEAGARQTYEELIKMAPDKGTKDALVFLLTREISHTHMFMKGLESLGKLTDPFFGNIQPDQTVDLYFNLSQGGKEEEISPTTSGKDERGPWNEEPTFKYIAQPLAER
ncbi:manganese catalase family protein [Microseira wollei]|uniref:Manganese containing catalase n=1 Tax=Microseira wollei NIES-4236 TaxID=2530354 RepID=A0AAV3XRN8_9CYAN|nr:manganese catalase family protein [Microseira wollei]GET44356.1 manganese containing catalase [Microseira wollei NIES-4236]